MKPEELGVCEAPHAGIHKKNVDCINWRPIEASVPDDVSRCEHCGTLYSYSAQGEYCANKDCPPYAQAMAEDQKRKEADIEEAVRIVDGMTCLECKQGWPKIENGRHHSDTRNHRCVNDYCGHPCRAQGRAIMDKIIEMFELRRRKP